MVNVKIHVPCKESECLLDVDGFHADCKVLEKDNIKVELIKHENNRKPIGQLYNEILQQIRSSDERVDYLIFLHSDAMMNVGNVIRRLQTMVGKYDIVGFAGAKSIDLKVSPLTWFTGSDKFKETRFGRVIQDVSFLTGDKENRFGESFFNSERPEVLDTQVATIDGCCMVLTSKVINSDILFNNDFLNDFYDIDFCLNARVNYDFSIGVLVEKIIHMSLGTSVLTPEYKEKEKVFRERWGLSVE